MGYREPETCPWLQVDSLSVELPGSRVASSPLVNVATNGSLWNWHNTKISLKARQCTKWIKHVELWLASSNAPFFDVDMLHPRTICVELWV